MRKMYPFLAVLALLSGCAKEEPGASSLPEADPFRLSPVEGVTPPEAGTTTVLASFAADPETRSRIELNADGTAAKVLWTQGDSFVSVCGIQDNGRHYEVTFTTEDDGVEAASFSTNSYLPNDSEFHCFHPDINAFTIYNGTPVFGLDLPNQQTAVAGGIAEGLNRSYAHADQLSKTMKESIRFHNITSMIRFRLSGDVASRVRQVTFSANGIVAGDVIFKVEDGMPVEYPGIHFGGYYSKITLSGTFEAGKDYYIVLWPRTTDGFRMEFTDGAGSSTLKQSSKTVTFEASRIKDFGTIDLGDEFEDVYDSSMEPIQYMTATEGSKPVTIAVIPEGFTRDQLDDYVALAKSGVDALFATEPYKTYRNRFNVYILKAASRETGASVTDGNGNITTRVNSRFGARWGQDSYSDMKADDDQVFEFVSEKCPDIVNGIHPVNEVPIIMLINDTRYGGICWSWSDGSGYAMVPYTYGGDGMMWSLPKIIPTTDDPLPTPVTSDVLQLYYRSRTQADLDEVGGNNYGDWRNTLVHEFGGHCFGRLGDEYWSSSALNYDANAISGHSWRVPFSLNVSTSPNPVTWQTLMDNRDDLVQQDALYSRIGVFQGGGTYTFGRWRSEKISCMIDNRFYYSAWQRYLITQRIFTLSGDGESFSYDSWLSNDVTTDPVRDVAGSGTPGGYDRNRTYTPVPPLPPPVLVEK